MELSRSKIKKNVMFRKIELSSSKFKKFIKFLEMKRSSVIFCLYLYSGTLQTQKVKKTTL